MPHTSKKARKSTTLRESNKLTYVAVAVIILIVAAAVGWYAYSSMKSTTSSTTTNTNSTGQVYAVINTTQGVMEAQLFPTVAPKTVANFVNLSNSGFYTDLVWHRIVAGFVIQTGDPTTKNGGGVEANWGQTGSSTTVPLETNASDVAAGYVNNEGYLAMARGSSTNSGSSQFFININPAGNTQLNGQYTVFGKLISGLSVALAIGNLPVNSACASSGDLTCQPINPLQALVLSITIKNSP